MTDVVLLEYEIEPGETDRLWEWLDELDGERGEVAELLQAEGMLTESLFVREREDGDSLLWYQEAEDLRRVMETYEAADGDLVEASKELFSEVLVGGLDRPVASHEPVAHAVNPER